MPLPSHLERLPSRSPLRFFAGLTLVVAVLLTGLTSAASSAPSTVAKLPPGFHDSVALTGLTRPTAIAFSRDGRIFVAEQAGTIRVFKSLSDHSAALFDDLSTDVNRLWESGLLGLALSPRFPSDPYVYVLYTRDAKIGGTSPLWNDQCPTPPGMFVDGCVVSSRLARLRAKGNTSAGSEQVLLDGWCQQYPTHSIGTIRFAPDGSLYASGGDGAGFLFADWGQRGGSSPASPTPRNPCGDPPAGVGGVERPPTAEGGALRAQSLRRPNGPAVLNGTVIRVNANTGNALQTNPLASSHDPVARRIVAYGLRNPFRFTFRPGTNELWIGDVGAFLWEEVDRAPALHRGVVQNFGWPCYEGPFGNHSFSKLSLCATLTPKKTTYPVFAYNHWQPAVLHDGCSVKPGASISGLAFYTGHRYPRVYRNGLFFADYTRGCIWFMPFGPGGKPDPHKVRIFETHAGGPVDLETGPDGDLFYVDLTAGTVHRITFGSG
jgi:glucose/arabinose dehydrogenase